MVVHSHFIACPSPISVTPNYQLGSAAKRWSTSCPAEICFGPQLCFPYATYDLISVLRKRGIRELLLQHFIEL